MGFVVTRLPQQPVLIARFELPLFRHLGDLRQFSALCANLLTQVPPPLTCIIDLSDSVIEYSDVLLLLHEMQQGYAGCPTDPRVWTLAVGTHPLIAVGAARVLEEFGVMVPQFPSVSAALTYVRAIQRAGQQPVERSA